MCQERKWLREEELEEKKRAGMREVERGRGIGYSYIYIPPHWGPAGIEHQDIEILMS